MRRQRPADELEREEEPASAAPAPVAVGARRRAPRAAADGRQRRSVADAGALAVHGRAAGAGPKPASAPADYDKARAERDAFVVAGKKGPVTYNPSTRNPDNYYGGFDVAYDPVAQTLQITVKGAIKFLPGMALKSGLAEAKEPSPEAAAAADAINALPRRRRAAEVKKWRWSKDDGPDTDDEKNFLAAFKSIVVSTWQGKHPFHCSKKYWEDLGADTVIDIQITEGDQGAADHMKMNAYKVPPTMAIAKADVTRTDAAKGAFGNTMNAQQLHRAPEELQPARLGHRLRPRHDQPHRGREGDPGHAGRRDARRAGRRHDPGERRHGQGPRCRRCRRGRPASPRSATR